MEQAKALPNRQVALDGLRGVAILLVLFNHFLPNLNYAPSRFMQWTSNLAQSGWIGVDLFFVLSGFLITRILIEAKESPNYFQTFYMRRVLRIFPLYFGALALVFIVLPLIGILRPADLGNVWTHQTWNWTYCTNVGSWLNDGSGFYCSYVCLEHFWSLAVEEHFYLVWPAVIFLMPNRFIKPMCLTCIAGVLATRFVAVLAFDASPGFYHLTPCRMDSLAYGGLIAASLKDGSLQSYRKWLFVLGGIAGVSMVFAFVHWRCLPAHHPINHMLGYSIYSVFFGAIVVFALSAKPNDIRESLFGNSFFLFFGKYSYGLYVIHGMLSPLLLEWIPVEYVIDACHSVPLGSIVCTILRILVVVGLSAASWHILEKQCLKLKRYFEYQEGRSTSHVMLPTRSSAIPA